MIRGVTKSLRNGRKSIPVLNDIELSTPGGSVCWIGGSNGAGKTTLLRIAAGILKPDRGEIRFGDYDPEQHRRQYQCLVGFLSAGDRGLYARISVRRQLQLWAKISFIEPEWRSGRVEAVIDEFGLTELAGRRSDRLSLGQRQRVKLALCFLASPRLVLLDEPMNSLDEAGMDALRTAVVNIRDIGGVILWCSPPSERSALPSDHQFLVRAGTLVPA